MNAGRAHAAVDELVTWIDEYNRPASSYSILTGGPAKATLTDMIRGRLPLIERIGDELEPDRDHHYAEPQFETDDPWNYIRYESVRLRGILADAELVQEIFDPAGPQLAARQMHLWVWSAAESLWETGHYREALQAAATAVESQAQAKTGRYDLAGADLFRKAFQLEAPHPDEPRLRLDYPPGGLSWRSAHEGAANLGAGCMMAIRNIVTHNIVVSDEAVALQQLAALSVLATWVDQARLEETAAPEVP